MENVAIHEFASDKRIAERLDLSASWVRKQRWLRRHGHEHTLDIDPVMIGGSPRYRLSDIQNWVENLGGES